MAAAAPGVAGAHLRTGTVAVDDLPRVTAPLRSAAFSVRVLLSDRALALSVRPGHSVVVLGYLGEPFLRVDGRGVAVNAASPTAVTAKLLSRMEPARGGAVWRVRPGDSVVWHDARTQSPPAGAGPVVWHVPVLVDGRPAAIRGETRRLPPPALWPWLALLGAFLVPTAALARRARAGATALAAPAGVAAVATSAGFALDAYASPGTWITALDETVLLLVAAGVMLRGPERARAGGAIAVGLLAVAAGLGKGAMFLHPIVLSVLPGAAARACGAVAVAAGVAAAALGCVVYAAALRRERLPSPLWQDLPR